MPDQITRGTNGDDVGLVLTSLMLTVVFGCLAALYTGPAVVGSLLLVALTWFSGSVRHVAQVLAFASLALFVLMASGVGLPLILHVFQSYAASIAAYGWAGFYKVWRTSFLDARHWLLNFPIGLSVASAIILLRDAIKNAPSTRLLEAKYPRRRREAPLVRIRRWSVGRSPDTPGFITIGTEKETGARVGMAHEDCFMHMIVAGTTGSGKTNSQRLIMSQCLRAGWAVTELDAKDDRELAEENCSLAAELGKPVFRVDVSQPDKSCIYNPFATGDATLLANCAIAIGEYSDPFYKKICLGSVQTAFKVLKAAGLPVDLIQIGEYLDTKRLLSAIHRKGFVDRARAQALASEVIAQKEHQKNIGGLRADIHNLSRSSLAHVFDTRDKSRKILDLAKSREEGAYVHIGLPGPSRPEFARGFGRLVIENIKAVAELSDRPWLIVLDEAHVYAGQNLIALAAMGRSRSVALMIAVQSYSQLQAVSASGPHPSYADSLLASANLHLVHRLTAPSDAELAAAMIGTVSDLEVTAQTESDVPSSLGSLRAVRSYLHHPDTLKRLTRGEAVFMNKIAGTISRVLIRKSN